MKNIWSRFATTFAIAAGLLTYFMSGSFLAALGAFAGVILLMPEEP